MKKQESDEAENHADNQTQCRNVVTVLHVDDDPNDTALLQVACARAAVNFELQNIEDGGQVIEYLSGMGKYADRARYRLPDLILLDLKMPRLAGLDVLKWIRNQSKLRDLPVIVLSGSELQEDIRQAYAVGADSYLVKPPTFTSLIHLVKEIGAQIPEASTHVGAHTH
jgi:CheY-like chemotaxis protein